MAQKQKLTEFINSLPPEELADKIAAGIAQTINYRSNGQPVVEMDEMNDVIQDGVDINDVSLEIWRHFTMQVEVSDSNGSYTIQDVDGYFGIADDGVHPFSYCNLTAASDSHDIIGLSLDGSHDIIGISPDIVNAALIKLQQECGDITFRYTSEWTKEAEQLRQEDNHTDYDIDEMLEDVMDTEDYQYNLKEITAPRPIIKDTKISDKILNDVHGYQWLKYIDNATLNDAKFASKLMDVLIDNKNGPIFGDEYLLGYFPEAIRDNTDIVKKACKIDENNIECASKRLQAFAPLFSSEKFISHLGKPLRGNVQKFQQLTDSASSFERIQELKELSQNIQDQKRIIVQLCSEAIDAGIYEKEEIVENIDQWLDYSDVDADTKQDVMQAIERIGQDRAIDEYIH